MTYDFDTGSPSTDIIGKTFVQQYYFRYKNGVKFLSMDLKDMFLHTPMRKSEYMKVPIKYFPLDI